MASRSTWFREGFIWNREREWYFHNFYFIIFLHILQSESCKYAIKLHDEGGGTPSWTQNLEKCAEKGKEYVGCFTTTEPSLNLEVFFLINFGIQNSQLKKLISILSYVCKSYMRTDLGTDRSILNNQWNMFIVS